MTGTTPIDTILEGDALTRLKELPSESVDCCITSPPYFGLRDYGVEGQIGLEESPEAYVSRLVEVFREVRRVLKKEGTLWLNLGDSYCSIGHKKSSSGYGTTGLAGGKAQEHTILHHENNGPGLKHKDLIGIPWAVAFALRADGWYLRSDIIWHKPNCMPESVTDRPTKSHEYIFLLSKSQKYYYDSTAILEPLAGPPHAPGNKPKFSEVKRNDFGTDRMQAIWGNPSGRNKRTVWTVATKPYSEAHFATFPEKLIEPCVLAGCPEGGICLDPFFGAGTTGLVAKKLGRHFVGIELNEAYIGMAQKRVATVPARLDRWAEVKG